MGVLCKQALILRRMAHTLRRVEPVPGPAGYFANGGFRNGS